MVNVVIYILATSPKEEQLFLLFTGE